MVDEQRELPLFPLNVVLFPGMVLPLHIFEDRYKLMMGTCMVTDQLFGVTLIKDGLEVGEPAEPFSTGTVARISRLQRLPDGRMNLLAVGVQRFRIVEAPKPVPYLLAQVTCVDHEVCELPPALATGARTELIRYFELMGNEAPPFDESDPHQAETLSYQVASVLRVDPLERQRLLEIDDPIARLKSGLALLRREREMLELISRSKNSDDSIGPFSRN